MCRRALLTKTGQSSITASQLRDNMSRGLHHRDRRSVSCCMSACTIVIVDQCLDVCQQIQYKLLYEVILEAYSSRGHRSVCCCMSTYTIRIVDQCVVVCQQVQYKFLHEVILEAYTSRDTRLTLGQLDSEFPTDIDVNKPNKRTDDEFKVWEGQYCLFTRRSQGIMCTTNAFFSSLNRVVSSTFKTK